MCGIVGLVAPGAPEDELRTAAWRMASTLRHRGPDDEGVWVDVGAGIALGHRRLAILDLSPQGHQPMLSESGRFVIVYNGEVYNFSDLRHGLEDRSHAFRGQSDTEVMLAAFEQWGVEQAVKRFIGMFAFALWDRQERLLYLVRDRLGIKPLYYGWNAGFFLFASELKALRALPFFCPEIDRNALALFLRHNYIPAPYSIYRGIYKLLPGTILTLRWPVKEGQSPAPVPYWSAHEVAARGAAVPFIGSGIEAEEQLEELLRDAVRLRMVADVPLGAFLSGGIDSSTVVALMQAQSTRPVKTFTIGFYDDGYNEASYAKEVARHLGTDHTELYVTPREAMEVIPKLPHIYDEPFSDSSQIPTFLVSQLARGAVTVSLSGDGGDELFGGYDRYFIALYIWKWLGYMAPALRRTVSTSLKLLAPGVWDRLLGQPLSLLGVGSPRGLRLGDRLHKVSEVLAVRDAQDLYHMLISHWKNPASVVPGAVEPVTPFTERNGMVDLPDFIQQMMLLDLITYLPDDILTKVDRASMAVSLEARVPLLDHRVVEFAWSLPTAMKIRNGKGKWLLRRVLYKYVPPELVERPKMGFGVPIDAWLRGPLQEWAEELLDERRLREEGFFNPEPIRQKWTEHLSGERNWHYYLWDVLMFQAWRQEARGQ